MGLAASRLGQPAVAEGALRTAVALACDRPGIPYANHAARGFSTAPAAASTLWFLLAEREIRTGVRAPVFPAPRRPGPSQVKVLAEEPL